MEGAGAQARDLQNMHRDEERAREQEAAMAQAGRQAAKLERQLKTLVRDVAYLKYKQDEVNHLQRLYEAIPLKQLQRRARPLALPRLHCTHKCKPQPQPQPPPLSSFDLLLLDVERQGGGEGYGGSDSEGNGGSGGRGTPAAGTSVAAQQQGAAGQAQVLLEAVAGTSDHGAAWQFTTPVKPAKRLRRLPQPEEQEEEGEAAAAHEEENEVEEYREEQHREQRRVQQQPWPQQVQRQAGTAGAGAAAAQALPEGRRKTVCWSAAEVQALQRGVEEHGSVAQWAIILREDREGSQAFHRQRVGGDLKDKWRNMNMERAAPQQRPPGMRRQTLPWSPAEEAELQRLVRLHRAGNWQAICDAGHQVFRNRRTNVDLQNKWRLLLERQARY